MPGPDEPGFEKYRQKTRYLFQFNHLYTFKKRLSKPRFLMSGTLIFPHNLQNVTYFVTKFDMRKFCVVP